MKTTLNACKVEKYNNCLQTFQFRLKLEGSVWPASLQAAQLFDLDNFLHFSEGTAESGLPCGRVGLVPLPILPRMLSPAFEQLCVSFKDELRFVHAHPRDFKYAFIFLDPFQAINASFVDLFL